MAPKVKVAVLGTGSLGKEHVRIYAELAAANHVEFVGVYDTSTETAHKIAARHHATVFTSVAEAAAGTQPPADDASTKEVAKKTTTRKKVVKV